MKIKALTFDTGGTILDWHKGLSGAFEGVGSRHGQQRDWHRVTNDYRRLAMKGIVGQRNPAFNMDDVHRRALDDVLAQHGLESIPAPDREELFLTWYGLEAWPDFPPALAKIGAERPVVSFTMLPVPLVISVSRKNRIHWDAVISCEMIGIYKPDPEAYACAARWLGLPPKEILMVACHNFDLDAARSSGFRTAFVHRPEEWGPEGRPDPVPNPANDIVVSDFGELAGLLE